MSSLEIMEKLKKLSDLYNEFKNINEEVSSNDLEKSTKLIEYATEINKQVNILENMGGKQEANDILYNDLEDQTINHYLRVLKEETVPVNSKKVRFGIFQIAAVLFALTLPLMKDTALDAVKSRQLASYLASYEDSMSDIVHENKDQHTFSEYDNEIAQTYAKTNALVNEFSTNQMVPGKWMEALKDNMAEMGKEVALFKMGTEMVPYEEKDTGLYAEGFEGTGLVPTRGYNKGDMSKQMVPFENDKDLERFKMGDGTLDNQTGGPSLESYGNDSITDYGGRRSRRKIRRSHKRRSCKKRKSRRKRQSPRRRKSRVSK